ncbi:uncharacterized protein LOC111701534 [Eurytemora carolleeae]|uniref:uncharacterized protein LOC111701534 n=1 Tax=Eurytemora carolleeae TaxID=1294199 RepID=UPI000C77E68C|nr:uncharacterized protein LOC111701534 [Eurytemora carolleeae]|eukprot:XP_023328615.1 uncharacterized protein LOC111701534 [Eurytemora affinis]
MPEPRQGHTAGVLGDTVYVCGGTSGKHIHERRDCLTYDLESGEWSRLMSPAPKGLAFSAVATGRNSLYLVGGRESLYKTSQDRPWETRNLVMEFSRLRRNEESWRYMPNMTVPGSDGCAAVIGQELWYIGEQGVEVLKNGEVSWKHLELDRIRNETYELRMSMMRRNQGVGATTSDQGDLEERTMKPVEFKFREEKKKERKERKNERNLQIPQPPQNSFPILLSDGELQRKDAAEERRRIKEEERRRRNLEKLQVENPSSIWDQIRNVFDKGSKGVDEIFNKDESPVEFLTRRKRQITRPPRVDIVTRAPWLDFQQPFLETPLQVPPVVQYRPPEYNPRDQKSNLIWPGQGVRGSGQSREDQNPRDWNQRRGKFQEDGLSRDRTEHFGGRDGTESPPRNALNDRRWEAFNPKESATRPPFGGVESLRPEEKMVGQGCAVSEINGEEGLLLAGGVWEGGRKLSWVPLQRPGAPFLEVIANLEEPRRWRPGVGRIAGRVAVIGGGDWGTDTIEVLDNSNRFKLLVHKLEKRRENTAAVTVDSSYFKKCKF